MKQHRIWMAALGLLAALASGCGDDTMGPDAGPDAGPGVDAEVPDAGPTSTAFLAGSDYGGLGIASILEVPSLDIARNQLAGVVSDDPVVRYFDGRIYVINRFNHDNVTIVDAATRTLVAQISTGAGSNPQDVAPRGSTLYVAALNTPGILLLDAERPQDGVVDVIDLSELDPNDDIPNCTSVYLVGDRLYATCGVLDGFDAVLPGKVAVIDTATNTLITSFDMETRNPLGFLRPTPEDSALAGDLLVNTVDFADPTSGCIERIDTGDTPGSRCLVSNDVLGGYAGGYVYGAEDTLYITRIAGYQDGQPVSALLTYNVALEALGDQPFTPADQHPIYVVQCPTGELVVAENLAGVRVYTAEGVELSEGPIDIGLPPVAQGMVCY